jgi:hypothetical protein
MKQLFSFLPAFMICTNLCAQVNTSVKAGASFANLYYKQMGSSQGRLTGYGGVSFNIDLQKQFFFQPEALYSIRGYRYPASAMSNAGTVTFGYITAPLLVGYKPAKNFSILAGPELGYMVRARSRFDGESYNILAAVNRRFNIDADAGIAWNISSDLTLDARFSFGVTAIYRGVMTDENGGNLVDVKDGYHRVLQVGFSLAL